MPRHDDRDLLLASTDSDGAQPSRSTTAAALLREARAIRPFEARAQLDVLPAVRAGQVLELCGAPGEGKTRISLAYAIEARLKPIPSTEASAAREVDDDREVLVVDTEGGLAAEVLHAAATEVLSTATTPASDASIIALLHGIHIVRVAERDQLAALLHGLPSLLSMKPRVGLLIIDSLSPYLRTNLLPTLLAAPSRQNGAAPPAKRQRLSHTRDRDTSDDPAAMRTHLLHLTRRTLSHLAARPLAIIATVQVATRSRQLPQASNSSSSAQLQPDAPASSSNAVMSRSGSGGTKGSSTLSPALGATWHASQMWRITLHADDAGRRLAHWTIVPPEHQKMLQGRVTAYQVGTGGITASEDEHPLAE